MPLYRASEMTNFFMEYAAETHACEVRINDGNIAVSYQGENGVVVYNGTEVEPGHFKLTSTDSVTGRATLHRFADDDILEGRWYEDRTSGMWQITLSDGKD
jgi:hypothetical protein